MKQSMYKNRDELPMFLTVMEVAGLLGISRASAYELVREDNFPKLKIVQGRTIIPVTDSSSGSMSRRDMTARKEANATISERIWGHLRFTLCFGNIPFPLAERSCLDCEEYFGAA